MCRRADGLDASFRCSVNQYAATFDPAKNARNIAERGLSFERVAELDWETAAAQEDTRKDYGETRIQVLAYPGERLHAAVITMRADGVHVISFRKADTAVVPHVKAQRPITWLR